MQLFECTHLPTETTRHSVKTPQHPRLICRIDSFGQSAEGVSDARLIWRIHFRTDQVADASCAGGGGGDLQRNLRPTHDDSDRSGQNDPRMVPGMCNDAGSE